MRRLANERTGGRNRAVTLAPLDLAGRVQKLRMAPQDRLDKVAARKPAVVVAGHMTADVATGLSGIAHTKAHLVAFEGELGKAKDSAGLKAAMEARFRPPSLPTSCPSVLATGPLQRPVVSNELYVCSAQRTCSGFGITTRRLSGHRPPGPILRVRRHPSRRLPCLPRPSAETP
jgi:hypothetical protein